MVQSQAKTVAEYLKELPADRRAAVEAVRKVFLDNLDDDYEEGMTYGMIGYFVPHRIYPAGYHCDPKQPLPFAGLASQKNHLSVYLMCTYGETPETEWFRQAWKKTGKKLDMGKSCIRFKKVEDLALDVIAAAIRRWPVPEYIARCEAAVAESKAAKATTKKPPAAKKAAAKKPVAKKPAPKPPAKKPAAKKSRG